MLSSALLALVHTAGCALPPELGLASRSDNLLHSLLQGESKHAEGQLATKAPPEASPYPTALKPGATVTARPAVTSQVPAAQPAAYSQQQTNQPQTAQPQTAQTPAPPLLPLQQGTAPVPRPLVPSELPGRLPRRYSDPATVNNTPPPRGEQRDTEPPADSRYSAARAATTLEPATTAESDWPAPSALDTAAPLEIWNQYFHSPQLLSQEVADRERRRAELAASTPPAGVQPASHVAASPPTQPPLRPYSPPTFPEPAPAGQPTEAPSPSDQAAREKQPPEPIDHLLERLIVGLEEEVRQKTERKEIDDLPALKQKLRLLQLIADRTDDAVDQIEQLPPAEREAFKQLMFALTTWLSPDDSRRSSLRNAKILRSLQEVNNRLSAASKLDLKSLIFCEKVESFGWYTEFPRAEFSPKQQVILYVEVQNFAAEEKTATAFETELAGSYQIFDAAGNIVDEHQLPLDREVCRNYRRDYFLAYRIHLPAEIQPGRYRLELTVEDLKAKKDFKGRKQGEAMIEFAIK